MSMIAYIIWGIIALNLLAVLWLSCYRIRGKH